MNVSNQILIREVAPRDGFQSWPEFIPTSYKLEIIQALIEAGVKEMETTSFVSPKAIPQMKDAAEIMVAVPRGKCFHSPLVPNIKGATLAIENGAEKIVYVISATDGHNLANVKRTVNESIGELSGIFKIAQSRKVSVIGAIAVAFGCPYQGDVHIDNVFRLAEAFLSEGASCLILADTTGMATPPRIRKMVNRFNRVFSNITYSLHLHNNRGTAMANLYAAIEEGAYMFDTALGGIGGCPNVPQAAGNLATEDVVYMVEDMGYSTGIDLNRIIEAALRLEKILGKQLPGQVMKSGPRDPKSAKSLCH